MRFLTAVFVLLALAFAQQQPALSQRIAPQPFSETSNLPLQEIGLDDLVGISVYDAPELTRTVRVATDGTIRLPLLKRTVRAAGLVPAELEASIGAALKDEGILVDPIVVISLVESRSRPISVSGAVKKPLTFQASGSLTLLDAISRADGLADDAGPLILVSRSQAGPDGKPVLLTQRILVKALIDASDPDLNLPLYGGEQIRVPEAGKVFVVGNVKKPGGFAIHDASETTVLKALAISEGLLSYSGDQAYIYRLEGASGSKNEIPIPLKMILDRKAPDVPLLADDILYVPDKRGRRNLMNVMEKLLIVGGGGLGAAAVYTAH